MSLERKWAYCIEHILDAISRIQRYTANMTEPEFTANLLVVDAVIRNFQVIGEAARRVPIELQARHPEIPWAQMMGMRNVIVHGYDVIRLDIVWRTIQENLPPLIEPLKAAHQRALEAEQANRTAHDG